MIDAEDIPVSYQRCSAGRVEYDPFELIRSIKEGVQRLVRRHPDCIQGIAGIGIANQGESFLLWDMDDGTPLTPVISWQDNRAETLSADLNRSGKDSWFHQKTGLHISPEWPALKVHEMRNEDAGLDARCRDGRVAYGQLDAWFLYEMSGRKVFATDHGTASRSGYYNLQGQTWDPELKAFFSGTELLFPDLMDNISNIPGVDLCIGREVNWIAGGVDQALTLIGQHCIEKKEAKVTYGTCCACWMNLGERILLDAKLTTSVAWKLGDKTNFALAAEGGASGNIIAWLSENFQAGWRQEQLSEIARCNDTEQSLIFVPAFNGLAAPWWKEAKGTLFGITAATRPEHILRAGLNAVAFTIRDILGAMPECGRIVFDGGMTDNEYLMKKQADVLGLPIHISTEREGTLMGVAFLCGWGLGLLPFGEFPEAQSAGSRILEPDPAWDQTEYERWLTAVHAVIGYYYPGAKQ